MGVRNLHANLTLPRPTAHGDKINEKQLSSKQTSKNCPSLAPEGDKYSDLATLCHVGDPNRSTQSLS
jgi:hypothetical protein